MDAEYYGIDNDQDEFDIKLMVIGMITFLFLIAMSISVQGTDYPVDGTRNLVTSTDQLYSYMNSNNFYTVYYGGNPSSGNVVKIVKDGVEMSLLPMALNWNNDLSQIQQISMPQSVSPSIQGSTITYTNAYGSGISLKYLTEDLQVKENVVINSFSNLPTPASYIISGGNPVLEVGFQLSTNAQHIEIDGADWDKVTEKTTTNDVVVKDGGGNVLYTLPRPYAVDNNGVVSYGKYVFKYSANKLYVRMYFDYSFLQTASYPVTIDPTFIVDYSPVPALHLYTGAVSSASDSVFVNQDDITTIISDNTLSTKVDVYEYTYSSPIPYFWYEITAEKTSKVSALDLDVERAVHDWTGKYTRLSFTGNPIGNGSVINIYWKARDTGNSFLPLYAHDSSGTQIYATFTSGSNLYHWENIVLQNIGTPITEVYISDLSESGSVELDYDYIEILPISYQGKAIRGRWSQTYDPVYDWFLRFYKDTAGTQTYKVYAYSNSNDLSTNYAQKEVTGTGWFNIDVNSLLDYELNTQGLTYTQLRLFSDEVTNVSEVLLRKEVNDTQPPVINVSSCIVTNALTEIETYDFGCLDTIEFECIVTDDVEVDFVTLNIDGQNYTMNQDATPYNHYDYYITPTTDGTTIYNWNSVTAQDIAGLSATENINKAINYTCNFDEYVNIIHTGTPTVDQINLTATSIVITWETSNPSDTDVDYGLSPTNLTEEAYNGDLVTSHIMPLTGLTPNTTYYYRVSSSVNPTQTLTGFNFTTPPIQIEIIIVEGVYNATIQTTSNLPVNSTVLYDENMTYLFSNYDANELYYHEQFLDSLLPDTIYYVNQTLCRTDPNQCFNYLYSFQTNSDCVENWVEDPYTCGTDDQYFSTFTDTNACGTTDFLPPTNGTMQYCNYCSEDMVQYLGECQETGFQTVDYVDFNYATCCLVTGLISDCSIEYYPYNETTNQSCSYFNNTMGDISCQNIPNINPREKEYCLAHLPNQYLDEEFKCISYVTSQATGEILQTNPEYRERSNSWFDFREDPETREYFAPANALVNFYYTDKNLQPEENYILTVECSSVERTLSSSMLLEMRYENYEFVFFRTKWLMENAGYVIAGIFMAFFILFVLLWIFKGVK